MQKLFYTVEEVMKVLNLGKNNVLELCRSKHKGFPAIQIKRKYLINVKLLNEWTDKITKDKTFQIIDHNKFN
ncbi:MAG: helix-turn-helix domain-containing protein [Tissierellia bacterium]|nr:helix-turn-helix domain-containing protein [Tissierellia bacterium]